MIVIETTTEWGWIRKHYEDIESQYLNFSPGCRVLPAQYYDEPHIIFTLKKKHDIGAQGFPNGGYELYGPKGETRSFELNQVIVHPFELGQINYFRNNISEEKKIEIHDPNKPKRGRGRPPKPEGEKKIIPTYVPTGRKRGRPANPNSKPKEPYVPTGGKRGRKPLSEEERQKREQDKLLKSLEPKRGRGRPAVKK